MAIILKLHNSNTNTNLDKWPFKLKRGPDLKAAKKSCKLEFPTIHHQILILIKSNSNDLKTI